MAKYTPLELTSLANQTSAISRINANLTAIQAALDLALFRDGTSPNAMEADLDMNSNQILNLPAAVSDTEPVRLAEFQDLEDEFTALETSINSSLAAVQALQSTLTTQLNTIADAASSASAAAASAAAAAASAADAEDLNFIELNDAPITYSGQALKFVRVNAGETGVEFAAIAGTAASITFTPAGNLSSTDVQAALAELDTEKQPIDSDLTSWASVTRAAGFDTFVATPSSANLASLLTDDAFSMSDVELGAIAGLTSAANKLPYFTGSGTAALADLSANMRTFMTTPSSANFATLVSDDLFSLADAELGALAGLTSAADKVPYFTGSGTAALADLSSAMRTFMTTPSMANLGSLLSDDASGWTTFGTTPSSANLGSLVTDDLFLLSDVELGAIAGLTSAADKFPYFTGSGTAALADLSSAMRTFLTTPSSANLASLISDDLFSLADAELGAIAGLVSAADKGIYFTGSGTASLFDMSSAMRTFHTTPSSANLASLISDDLFSLADAELGAIAGLTSAADKFPYFTGSGTAALADLSSAMRTFLTTPSSANLASLVSDDVFSLADAELGAIAGLVSAADKIPYFTGSGTASMITSTAAGRTAVTVADPGFDRPMFWDDSADTMKLAALADITTEAAPATGDYLLMLRAEDELVKVNWSAVASGGGATPALDNLSAVAINTSLISDTDNTDDLGSSVKKWKDGYFAGAVRVGTIELGADSDTTIARTAAGEATIEGDLLYNAGNTASNAGSVGSNQITCDVNNGTKLFWTRTMAANETLLNPTNMPTGATIDFYVDPGAQTQTPVVQARTTGEVTADGTAHTITLPSNIVPGEVLLAVVSMDGSVTATINTSTSGYNWRMLGQATDGTAAVSACVVWKIAEGSDALALTLNNSQQSSWVSFRISNCRWVEGVVTTGSSTNSDPPSLTPIYGSQNYLWIATRSGDAQVVATVAPTNYSNLQTKTATNSTGASTNTAERSNATATENPGTFTSNTEQWVSFTLGLSPDSYKLSFDTGFLNPVPNVQAKSLIVVKKIDTTPTFLATHAWQAATI